MPIMSMFLIFIADKLCGTIMVPLFAYHIVLILLLADFTSAVAAAVFPDLLLMPLIFLFQALAIIPAMPRLIRSRPCYLHFVPRQKAQSQDAGQNHSHKPVFAHL